MPLYRRPFLIALATVAVVLAGCGKKGEPTASTSSTGAGAAAPADGASAVAGGELVFAFDGAAVTQFVLDPHKSLFAPHHRVIRSIFDSLVVLLPGNKFGPWLAKSWEISPDGKTYTFHLRDDVKFHDGTRFDAAAVKFNLDRVKDPKNALMALSDIQPYASSTVVDDFTLKVQLSTPYAPLLANLSKSSLGIVSPTAVQKLGDAIRINPVGTGPFKLKSVTPGTEIALERNPDYRWAPEGSKHAGPAWLDRLIFKNVPEESTRVAVLQGGQAQAADLVPPQHLLSLRQSPEFRVVEGELLNHNYGLYLNVTHAPWDDARIREAFRKSLDVDAAVRTIYLGTLKRAWSPLSPSILGYDATLENSWKFDRAGAAKIFDEHGWKTGPDGVRVKDGKRLSLVFVDFQGNREKRLDVLTILRRQLRDNGIEVVVQSEPSGAYQARLAKNNYELTGGSLFAPDPDVLRRIHAPGQRTQLSVSRTDDPDLNRILNAAYQEGDEAKRVALYKQAQHLIVERTYVIPIYVLVYPVVTQAKVHGVAIDAHGFPAFNDAWISK